MKNRFARSCVLLFAFAFGCGPARPPEQSTASLEQNTQRVEDAADIPASRTEPSAPSASSLAIDEHTDLSESTQAGSSADQDASRSPSNAQSNSSAELKLTVLPLREVDYYSAGLLNSSFSYIFSDDGKQVLLKANANRGYLYDVTEKKWSEVRSLSDVKTATKLPELAAHRRGRGGAPLRERVDPTDENFGGIVPCASGELLGVDGQGLFVWLKSDRPPAIAHFDRQGNELSRFAVPKGMSIEVIDSNSRYLALIVHAKSAADSTLGLFDLRQKEFIELHKFRGNIVSDTRSGAQNRIFPGNIQHIAAMVMEDMVRLYRPGQEPANIALLGSLDSPVDWAFVNQDRWLLILGKTKQHPEVKLWLFDTDTNQLVQELELELDIPELPARGQPTRSLTGSLGRRPHIIQPTSTGRYFMIDTTIGVAVFEINDGSVQQLARPATSPHLALLKDVKSWSCSPTGDLIATRVRRTNEAGERVEQNVLIDTQSLVGHKLSPPQSASPPVGPAPVARSQTTADYLRPLYEYGPVQNENGSRAAILRGLSPHGKYLASRHLAVVASENGRMVNQFEYQFKDKKVGDFHPIFDLDTGRIATLIEQLYKREQVPFRAALGDPRPVAFGTNYSPVTKSLPASWTIEAIYFDAEDQLRLVAKPMERFEPNAKPTCFHFKIDATTPESKFEVSRSFTNLVPTLNPNVGMSVESAHIELHRLDTGQSIVEARLASTPGSNRTERYGGASISPDGRMLVVMYDQGLMALVPGAEKHTLALPYVSKSRMLGQHLCTFVTPEWLVMYDHGESCFRLIDVAKGKELFAFDSPVVPTRLARSLQVSGNGRFVCFIAPHSQRQELFCLKVDNATSKFDGIWHAELPVENFKTWEVLELLAAPNAPVAVIATVSVSANSSGTQVWRVDLAQLTANTSPLFTPSPQ